MATALVLAADGRRDGGRWKRGTVDVGNDQSVNISDWQQRLRKSGIVLDYKNDSRFGESQLSKLELL